MATAATRTALPMSGHALYLGMATAATTAALPTSGLLCSLPEVWLQSPQEQRYLRQVCYVLYLGMATATTRTALPKSGLLCSLPG